MLEDNIEVLEFVIGWKELIQGQDIDGCDGSVQTCLYSETLYLLSHWFRAKIMN